MNPDDLYDAAYRGDAGLVTLLLLKGADLDHRVTRHGYDGWTPLHIAARNGHTNVVDLLVEHGAKVNTRDNNGATAVYRSAQSGYANVVKQLVLAKADLELQNNHGRSPLSIAAMLGHENVIDVLVTAGVDVRAENKDGDSPLHVAIQYSNCEIAVSLVKAGADVNAQCNTGTTPLMLAAKMGQGRVVYVLLHNGADAASKLRCGSTAFDLACFYGHADVALVLLKHCHQASIDLSGSLPHANANIFKDCVRLVEENQLPSAKMSSLPLETESCISERLHSELLRAGFHETRAALQAATATFLENILRMRRDNNSIFIVGSYAEGWGSSLVALNGKIDVKSDIDMTQFSLDEPLHISGSCTCKNPSPGRVVQYEDGHVKYGAYADSGLSYGSNPATAHSGSALRPAVDIVSAIRCCCYPHMPVIHDYPLRRSNITPAVMQALKSELKNSQCHLVCANPPGQMGQLRVSTTFLERKLLRSLKTVQGHLFIFLKYLLKHEINTQCKGLKTYHVKTLLFQMLDETPEVEWRHRNLLQLTRQALKKLLTCLQRSGDPKHCMTHFFIEDAAIYLRSGHDTKDQIAEVLKNTNESLPVLVDNWMRILKPTGDSFQFHPFLIIPDIFILRTVPSTDRLLRYDEVYDAVCEILLQLVSRSSDEDSLQHKIQSLPNCAYTVRKSLTAMACLRFGKRNEAIQVLRDRRSIPVSRGICCPIESPVPTLCEVQQRLEGTDSAWRFLFLLDERPELGFLPELSFIRRYFPCNVVYYTYQYMNFDALLKCLCLELIPDAVLSPRDWFKEILQRDDCDKQDLLMSLHYCQDIDLLVQLTRKHKSIVCSEPEIAKLMTADQFENLEELQERCARATLEEMRQRLRNE